MKKNNWQNIIEKNESFLIFDLFEISEEAEF